MIEAVNSVLSNAPLLRGNAEQATSARAVATAETVSRVPQAPYVSPYISFDTNFDKAVLQIRDGDTGDVVRQFPSESALEAVRRAQTAQQAGGLFQAAETPEVTDTGEPSQDASAVSLPEVRQVPQAQLASAALAAGAKAGVETMSAGVSVLA